MRFDDRIKYLAVDFQHLHRFGRSDIGSARGIQQQAKRADDVGRGDIFPMPKGGGFCR